MIRFVRPILKKLDAWCPPIKETCQQILGSPSRIFFMVRNDRVCMWFNPEGFTLVFWVPLWNCATTSIFIILWASPHSLSTLFMSLGWKNRFSRTYASSIQHVGISVVCVCTEPGIKKPNRNKSFGLPMTVTSLVMTLVTSQVEAIFLGSTQVQTATNFGLSLEPCPPPTYQNQVDPYPACFPKLPSIGKTRMLHTDSMGSFFCTQRAWQWQINQNYVPSQHTCQKFETAWK